MDAAAIAVAVETIEEEEVVDGDVVVVEAEEAEEEDVVEEAVDQGSMALSIFVETS